MRFPWQDRADEERRLRKVAEARLAKAESNWPVVREHANALREQRELNGWTGVADALFANRRKG